MSRLEHRPGEGRGGGLFMRVIARSYQGTRFDVAEAETQGFVSERIELFRRVEASYGEMIPRGPQVLPDGKNVHVALAQIAENLNQFFGGLAQTNHHPALGYHAGGQFLD